MHLSAVSKYFKIFDLYGESAGFTIDNGNRKYNSVIGAALSIVVFAAVVSQSIEKFGVLVTKGDTNHQEFYQDQAKGKVVNSENSNFTIAFGIVQKERIWTSSAHDFFQVQVTLLSKTEADELPEKQILPLKRCEESDIKNINTKGDDDKAD